MNILFLTLIEFDSLTERNIYTDLLREFVKAGHTVYAISPVEKRKRQKTRIVEEKSAVILRLKIGNTQKTNVVEKGISTVMIAPTFRRAIRKYFPDVKFDLVLYSTPPITLLSAVEYVKARDGAKTYLLLKDIFPQNAVDMGMLSKTGAKGFLYRHFRRQEKRFYRISDRIGCMSPANVEYVTRHNPDIAPEIVEVCPNSVEVIDRGADSGMRKAIREKYGIPLDKKVFVYGGNLGKAQGVPFIIECMKAVRRLDDVFFLIVGSGTEYGLLKDYADRERQENFKLMRLLPKEDYDTMIAACDVGLIFLDYRFTIPNFPSRLLSYMQAKIPVLAATDPNTDVGQIIEGGGFGWRCGSDAPAAFAALVERIARENFEEKGRAAFDYLRKHYDVRECFQTIMNGLF